MLLRPSFAEQPSSDSIESGRSNHQDASLIRLDPLDALSKYPPVVTALSCTKGGKWLVAAGDDHALRVVQLRDGQTLQTLKGHSDWVQAVATIEESRLVFSCSNDGTLRSWSESNGWSSKIVHQSDVALMAIAIDSANEIVACLGFGHEIWIYSIHDGKLLTTLRSECSDQRAVAFSSDGRQLAAGGRDGSVRVWDWKSDRQPLEQQLHRDRIRSLSFSDDDSGILSIGEDRHFIKYQPSTGKVLLDRKITSGRLLSMASINTEMIAIAGSDNTIRIVEIVSGTEINRLVGHDGSVAVMVCCGDHLISGSFDTTIRVWDLSQAMHKSLGNYEHPVSARFQDSGVGESVR